jgi:hypothetical protein
MHIDTVSEAWGFLCVDCQEDTDKLNEYYMVRDTVWKQAKGPAAGMLCIGCLERRIGRRLRRADFLPCALNDGSFPQSRRLKARLSKVMSSKRAAREEVDDGHSN